ncbi:MAG: DinB family protein [Anaerolineae bacterium]|nr:DinB family protein [Anaerolineae bacterium]
MLASIPDYLTYFAGLRRRTLAFGETLPADQIDWSPGAGEFSCGDILRHIGAVQLMNWRAAAGQGWYYGGHEAGLGSSKADALAYLENCSQQAHDMLKELPDEALHTKQPDLRGRPIAAWRYLMATVEHEIHHRSQLASYYYLMNIEPPQLYGVYMEDLPRDQGEHDEL